MTAFLKKRGFDCWGSNGQPRAHHNLPFRIQNWKKTVEVDEADEDGNGRFEYEIQVDLIIADDTNLSGYAIYRIDYIQTEDDGDTEEWTDAVYVSKADGPKMFDKAVEYVLTLPTVEEPNMCAPASKEKYQSILDGSRYIQATDVV